MRNIAARPELSRTTASRLIAENNATVGAADRKAAVDARYAAARSAAWFREIPERLSGLAGYGIRCMVCSSSESSQVEHYRPKAIYPERAFEWANFLWLCGMCNQTKGDRFEESNPPINPVDDDVWEFFFIDEFGNLTAKWNVALDDYEPRAVRTIELHNLDRQALQECREARLIDLRAKAADAVEKFQNGALTLEEVESRALSWFLEPFQPDIADYFFIGPGKDDPCEPFKNFLELIDS